jgi:hypothetical protein
MIIATHAIIIILQLISPKITHSDDSYPDNTHDERPYIDDRLKVIYGRNVRVTGTLR